jgi:hypothetical protein
MSTTQNEKASHFCALHDGPGALIIPNPFDIGSTRIMARRRHFHTTRNPDGTRLPQTSGLYAVA